MNYQKTYGSIIEHRKSNKPTGYTETHHILPKSLGGSNHKDNLVELTAREHFIAHRLLAKIHGGKMWSALWMMCHGKTTSGKGLKISSRTYEITKIKHAQRVSERFSGENHPNYKRPMTDEQKKKISENLKGRYTGQLNPNFGKKHDAATRTIISEKLKGRVGKKCAFYGKKHSDETRKRLSEIRRSENRCGERNSFYGMKHSEETRKILSEKHTGKILADEHKEKIAQKIRERCSIRVQCPHCLRLISTNSINRFHNDNCKMKQNE